jgi:asparagine synthetase B (glutamine-hydrolysing)
VTLRPFANLLAVRRQDPGERDQVARTLRADPAFTRVETLAGGWVMAMSPLPHGPEEPSSFESGIAFAEGRDVVGVSNPDLARRVEAAPERLGEVPGDFTMFHVGRSGGLTAVRSAGGIVPVYWADDVVATTFRPLLGFLRRRVEIDPLPNAISIAGSGWVPQGRSFVRGVHVLARGRYLRMAGATTEGTYWDPRPARLEPPSRERHEAHAARLRAILLERLAADLDSGDGNLLALSGGIDSTCLLCLSAGTLGRAVSAVSLLPPPGPLRELEAAFIASASARGPLRRHRVFSIAPRDRLAVSLDAVDPGYPVPHPVLQVLPAVLREFPATVLVGGEFGDEVGGSHFTLPDWVSLTPFRRVLTGGFPYGPQDVGRWIRRRLEFVRGRPRLPLPHALPGWTTAAVREELADEVASTRAAVLRERRPLWHLALRAAGDGWLAMNWEACSALGVRRSVPFFNRAVLELAFECHPGELIGPGVRRLTRTALATDVPRANLHRGDKGQWRLSDPGTVPWSEPLPASLAGVVREDWLQAPPGPVGIDTATRLSHLVRFVRSIGLANA